MKTLLQLKILQINDEQKIERLDRTVSGGQSVASHQETSYCTRHVNCATEISREINFIKQIKFTKEKLWFKANRKR